MLNIVMTEVFSFKKQDGVALPRLRRAHPCTMPFFPLCDKSPTAVRLLSHRGKNSRVQGSARRRRGNATTGT
jgi:hypothetical protein